MMKVLVIYCHPSNKSFTARMKDEFIRGLEDGGHTCQLIDLYQINFDETFSEEEYLSCLLYTSFPSRTPSTLVFLIKSRTSKHLS